MNGSFKAQEFVSIGYCSSFSSERDVLIRKSMLEKDGLELVNKFIEKMEDLQQHHFSLLPKTIHEKLKSLKFQMQLKTLPVKVKAEIVAKFRYLQNMTKLKIIGFNSNSYDLPCLFSYLLESMGPENVEVIKKGASFIFFNYNLLSFRDAMNYSLWFSK